MHTRKRRIYTTLILMAIISLSGCTSPNYAPVNSRKAAKNNNTYNNNSEYMNQPAPPTYNPNNANNGAITSPISNPAPVVNMEAAPLGYYRVMPGDTLYKIARENNIHPKELIEWNALENPNNLQPYQLVRISSGTGIKNNTANTTNSINTTKPPNVSTVVKSPISNNLNLNYPVKNPSIIKKFDGKGVDFAGKLGDPVMAAGDGTVIYAQSMRGYGNLVIIAHALDIVTAYAHLQHINVKEQQHIKQGQTIGSIGNTQSDNVKLHFEVRKKSEPVDPIPYIK